MQLARDRSRADSQPPLPKICANPAALIEIDLHQVDFKVTVTVRCKDKAFAVAVSAAVGVKLAVVVAVSVAVGVSVPVEVAAGMKYWPPPSHLHYHFPNISFIVGVWMDATARIFNLD